MAQISEITRQDIDDAKRFDAEYFQSQYLQLDVALANHNTESVGNFAFVTDGQHGYHKVDSESGIAHITAKCTKNFFVTKDDVEFLAQETHDMNERSQLQENDVLLASAGTIGCAGIVGTEILPANIDQDVARIHVEKKNMSPQFLLVFLNSKYGFLQTERAKTGTRHVSLKAVREIRIPIDLPQDSITELVISAKEKSIESKALQRQAEEVLLSELGLDQFSSEYISAYETDIESIMEAARMDAEYFQPKFREIVKKVRRTKHGTLGSLVSYMKKGIEVGNEAYTDLGKPFIRVSNFSVHGINNNNQQYIREDLYRKLSDKFEPKKGEVLLSKDGTPGMAFYVDEAVSGIVSGGLLRLKPMQEIEGEYLALVLNSLVVQMQMKRDAGGALITHWRPDQVKNTLIPILDSARRAEIVSLVRRSKAAKKESSLLLENAIKQVEEMIYATSRA